MISRVSLWLLVCLVMAGCAGRQVDQVAVRTGAPVVHIHPTGGDYQRASVLILPFQVPGKVDPLYGRRVAALYHEVFLGKETFQRILLSDQVYGSYEEALEQGRAAGVDLVVAGRLNYLLSGSQLGGARADVSLRVVNVKSGNTVWYLSQVMDQMLDHPEWRLPWRLAGIFNLPKIKSSSAPSSLPNMLAHIAMSMGEVMSGHREVAQMGRL